MNGGELFIDTNIILYLLNGDKTISELLKGKSIFISFITELELLGFKDLNPEGISVIKEFLADISILDIDAQIKTNVIALRNKYSIKLPDAIIAASALNRNITFISADKGFEKIKELDLMLYEY
jgi:predicted nucleic acid-binding protein